MAKYIVRHGVMRNLGVFASNRGETYTRGADVIARTSRGLEAGHVLGEANGQGARSLTDPKSGQILRMQTPADKHELKKIHEQERAEYQICQKRVEELDLNMQLIDIEHLFGGERIVVYYLSEGRIDFRELVKLLAGDFQTRIEMRQIGVRDEAKLLADYGDCGQPVCCNTVLVEMPPVAMKMAKLQKATLDPNKISGRCGRLKCCLRYEYQTYRDMYKALPRVGADILTATGKAHVLAQEILTGQLLVQTEDMRRIFISVSDVESVLAPARTKKKT